MQPLASDDPAEIGRYRLRGRLGAGGMGRVYLASTPAGRPVALKVVRPELGDDEEFRARFRQEIQAARRVHGLYTAELLDADPAATPPWLVTAYVPGPSLQQAVTENGPMPEPAVFRLIAGVAEALQAIHSADVVHRDLKPSNVVLGPDGPRVIDFGIARALEATVLTRSGTMVGTPQFMAPEQILDRPVTPMIDIFALGSLAAYAAQGRAPFGEGHPAAVAHRVLYEPPDLGGCPPQLRAMIEPCLVKQAASRPALDQILQFCLDRAAVTADSVPPSAAARSPAPQWPVTGPPSPAVRTPTEVVATPSRRQPTAGDGPPPAGPEAPRRPVPPSPVVSAVRLMYIGAILSICAIVMAIVVTPALQAKPPAGQQPDAAAGIVGTAVVGGILAGAIWLWAARRIRHARPGARFTATGLFILNSIGVFSSSAAGLSSHPTFVFSLAEWGVGLIAIVFLWDRRSGQYFAEVRQARQQATPQWRREPRQRGKGSRHRKAT